MATPTGDAEAYEFAYREGKEAVAEQAVTLRETRDRVALVVSTAAALATLASSVLLSSQRPDRLNWWGIVGLMVAGGGFLLVIAAAIVVWLPVEGVFVWDSGLLIGSYVEGESPAQLPEIHRELALHLGNNARVNGNAISTRLSWFSAGLVGFGLEVGGIVAAMIDVAK